MKWVWGYIFWVIASDYLCTVHVRLIISFMIILPFNLSTVAGSSAFLGAMFDNIAIWRFCEYNSALNVDSKYTYKNILYSCRGKLLHTVWCVKTFYQVFESLRGI